MILFEVLPLEANYVAACGDPGLSEAQALQVVASHELAESVTDPGVGVAAITGDPSQVGWFDPVGQNEVADICDAQGGDPGWSWSVDNVPYLDTNGNTYEVQQYWSNWYTGCAPTYPDAPRRLRTNRLKGGRVAMNWLPPRDDGRAPVRGYDIFANIGKGWKNVATVLGTSWTSPKSPYGHAVRFKVDAWNETGGETDGDDSKVVTVIPASYPRAVPWLRAVRSGHSVSLSWGTAADNGSAIRRYAIQTPTGTVNVPARARSVTLRSLKRGTYRFTVFAVNSLGPGVRRSITTVVR